MSPQVQFIKLPDRSIFIEATKFRVAAFLMESFNQGQTPTLFLSGGSTPGPAYNAISELDVDWCNVRIAQVDERWVDANDKASNAKLIRSTLLTNRARDAKFYPMKTSSNSQHAAAAAQVDVENSYKSLFGGKTLAVLGMGMDGHTCSWFRQAEGLEAALDPKTTSLVQAIKARKSDVTGENLERMTLTYNAVSKCDAVILLITGPSKLDVIETVLSGKGQDLPVSRLLNLSPEQFTILHAP